MMPVVYESKGAAPIPNNTTTTNSPLSNLQKRPTFNHLWIHLDHNKSKTYQKKIKRSQDPKILFWMRTRFFTPVLSYVNYCAAV